MLCIGLIVMWCQVAAPPQRAAEVRCPPLVTYDRATQAQAAAELRKGSPLAGMIADYGTLRDRCRAFNR